MRRNGIKSIVLISSAMLILGGCTATQQGSQEPNSGLSKTQIGAISRCSLGCYCWSELQILRERAEVEEFLSVLDW